MFMVLVVVMVVMVIAMVFFIGIKGEGVDERLLQPWFQELGLSGSEGQGSQEE